MDQYKNIYFLGIGGIGMSALARYFHLTGLNVAGYDKTPSPLTRQLESEGISIHFNDDIDEIPDEFKTSDSTLIVITPAIPTDHQGWTFFKSQGFQIKKRAEVLGLITDNQKTLAVAGTHGKTTTSCLLAHILHFNGIPINAFLGGISNNIQSNYLGNSSAEYTVVEADEFDRSFLQLEPYISIVTSTDADHLDIYADKNEFKIGFEMYVSQIKQHGLLIAHTDTGLDFHKYMQYSQDHPDNHYRNIRIEHGEFKFDATINGNLWSDVVLGIPGIHNVENALACILVCINIGLNEQQIRNGLRTFEGVYRRFQYHVRDPELIFIDDYAHHPTEIRAFLSSIKLLYPEKKITCIFQPHLFSRTRDFFDEFVAELSQADEIIIMPIYPAREKPIPGITSESLVAKLGDRAKLMNETEVLDFLRSNPRELIVTLGAGDIDRLVPKIKTMIRP